jgi:DNA-binding GntR family transcriptional regulator
MTAIAEDAAMEGPVLFDAPPRRGERGQNVADYLCQAIKSGRYAPGQRLVEADLTAELGVSRGPVREAFRKLAAEGLVEIVPNRGALVRRLSITEAIELFQIRAELEALAARLASARVAGDPCVGERFRQDTAQIWREEARHSTSDYILENQDFHRAVFAAAGNGQLAKLYEQLQLSLILSQISSALSSEAIAASLAEHRQVAEAIMAGDAARAEKASRRHLKRAVELVRAMPQMLFRKEAEQAALSVPRGTT